MILRRQNRQKQRLLMGMAEATRKGKKTQRPGVPASFAPTAHPPGRASHLPGGLLTLSGPRCWKAATVVQPCPWRSWTVSGPTRAETKEHVTELQEKEKASEGRMCHCVEGGEDLGRKWFEWSAGDRPRRSWVSVGPG